MTIKYAFPIHVIYYLLDELHGNIFFPKLEFFVGYHLIIMRQEYIPKQILKTHEGNLSFWLSHLDLLLHLQHLKAL